MRLVTAGSSLKEGAAVVMIVLIGMIIANNNLEREGVSRETEAAEVIVENLVVLLAKEIRVAEVILKTK